MIEPLILTMADTVESKLLQARLLVFARDRRKGSARSKKGWQTRREGHGE